MKNDRPGRARQRKRARPRRWLIRLARSAGLYTAVRRVANFILLAGMLIAMLGMSTALIDFAGAYSNLASVAGPDGVASAAVGFIQSRLSDLLGFSPREAVSSAPEVSGSRPAVSTTPTPREGAGFLPYQVEVSQIHEHAPRLGQLPRLPVTGPTPMPEPGLALFLPLIQNASPAPVEPAPAPTPTAAPPAPTLVPGDPDRIVIPSINLDAPVELAAMQTIWVNGRVFEQWGAPNHYAAGWQEGSAALGAAGNTVFNGHHNIYGEVFGRLFELDRGSEVIVYAGDRDFHYVVTQVMKLEERDAGLEQRMENARWILPSDDERLTLVTCWPPDSNAYRLILVAVPLGR